ncbi:MAG: ABC transporter ATP-binding protein [Spirochaetales bacterium]|nr:ABC transporter ATP-binding protein [Spirochaetales bacterium]
MSILEVKNLSFSFPGGEEILSELSVTFTKGSLTVIAGKNGSGKTVLMKNLNGILLPSRGEVRFGEKSTVDHGAWIRQKVGLVFQDADSCIVGHTVMDDILFGPSNLMMCRQESGKAAKRLLKEFGLWDKKDLPPRFLSGGEKKKLTMAGILIMNPEVIILDEPFVGLDFPGVRELLNIILALKEEGRTLVIISHDLEKILAHTDRLIIMEKGRIVKDGKPEELLDSLDSWGIRRPPERCLEEMTWLIS